MAPVDEKNKNFLYIGIIAVVILVVIGAVAGYLYLDSQNKQNRQRESLKQAFGDQLNETGRQYALIDGYGAAGNKNYVDEFKVWVDGYQHLAENYTQAVAQLTANGAAYQKMLANGSSVYENVTLACIDANDTLRSVNDTAADYEKEYTTRLGLRDNASADYNLAVNRSYAIYQGAWNLMLDDANYSRFGGYHRYLMACDRNNSYYNSSTSLAGIAGAKYQAYLKGSEYSSINTTIFYLQDNSTKLGKRYAELLKRIPNVNLTEMDSNLAWSSDKGFYEAINFVVVNYNRKNNTWPMKIWDVVVHYKLIDTATGKVRSSDDVSVPITDYYLSDIYYAILPYDKNRTYRTTYTISFEY